MIKREERLSFIYLLCGLFFLIQAVLNIEIIPVEYAIKILGIPSNIEGFFWLAIYSVLFSMASYVGTMAYARIFSKGKEWAAKIASVYFVNGMVGFFTICITIFSFGILSLFKILPMQISFTRTVYLYMFWFFVLKMLNIRPANNK